MKKEITGKEVRELLKDLVKLGKNETAANAACVGLGGGGQPQKPL